MMENKDTSNEEQYYEWKTLIVKHFPTPHSYNAYRLFQKQNSHFPTPESLRAAYKTWNNWLKYCYGEEAKLNEIYIWTKSDCENAILEAYQMKGEPFTMRKYDTWRRDVEKKTPSRTAINKHFDSFATAVMSLGIDYRTRNDASVEKVIFHLQECANLLGTNTLTLEDYRDYRRQYSEAPGETSIRRLFSTWTNALSMAGLNTPIPRKARVTESDCLVDLKKAYQHFNRGFAFLEYGDLAKERGWIGGNTILQRFDTWNAALTEAGIPLYHRSYSVDELKKALIEAKTDLELSQLAFADYLTWYTMQEMREKKPSPYTYLMLYGTWENTLIQLEM